MTFPARWQMRKWSVCCDRQQFTEMKRLDRCFCRSDCQLDLQPPCRRNVDPTKTDHPSHLRFNLWGRFPLAGVMHTRRQARTAGSSSGPPPAGATRRASPADRMDRHGCDVVEPRIQVHVPCCLASLSGSMRQSVRKRKTEKHVPNIPKQAHLTTAISYSIFATGSLFSPEIHPGLGENARILRSPFEYDCYLAEVLLTGSGP